MEKKLSTPVEVLCKGFPDEFVKYLAYCRNLRFEEKPEYLYCYQLFRECFKNQGCEKDNVFDWNKIAKEKKAEMTTNGNTAPQQTTEDQLKV